MSKSVIIFHIYRLSAILVSRFLLDLQAADNNTVKLLCTGDSIDILEDSDGVVYSSAFARMIGSLSFVIDHGAIVRSQQHTERQSGLLELDERIESVDVAKDVVIEIEEQLREPELVHSPG